LSWLKDGKEDGLKHLSPSLGDTAFASLTPREWVCKALQFICHTVILAILQEPYRQRRLIVTVYALLFCYYAVFGPSCTWRALLRRRVSVSSANHRPRRERVVVFCMIQVVFGIVLLSTGHSLLPITGSKISDLDQVGSLLSAGLAMVLEKRRGFMAVLVRVQHCWAGFSVLRGDRALGY